MKAILEPRIIPDPSAQPNDHNDDDSYSGSDEFVTCSGDTTGSVLDQPRQRPVLVSLDPVPASSPAVIKKLSSSSSSAGSSSDSPDSPPQPKIADPAWRKLPSKSSSATASSKSSSSSSLSSSDSLGSHDLIKNINTNNSSPAMARSPNIADIPVPSVVGQPTSNQSRLGSVPPVQPPIQPGQSNSNGAGSVPPVQPGQMAAGSSQPQTSTSPLPSTPVQKPQQQQPIQKTNVQPKPQPPQQQQQQQQQRQPIYRSPVPNAIKQRNQSSPAYTFSPGQQYRLGNVLVNGPPTIQIRRPVQGGKQQASPASWVSFGTHESAVSFGSAASSYNHNFGSYSSASYKSLALSGSSSDSIDSKSSYPDSYSGSGSGSGSGSYPSYSGSSSSYSGSSGSSSTSSDSYSSESYHRYKSAPKGKKKSSSSKKSHKTRRAAKQEAVQAPKQRRIRKVRNVKESKEEFPPVCYTSNPTAADDTVIDITQPPVPAAAPSTDATQAASHLSKSSTDKPVDGSSAVGSSLVSPILLAMTALSLAIVAL